MKRRTLLVVGMLATGGLTVTGLAGCSSDDTSAPTTTRTTPGTGDVAATGSIADVDFYNGDLEYPNAVGETESIEKVTVTNGTFERDSQPNSFFFQVRDVEIADLDGDGVDEAAVSINYSTGGSGQFTDVVVYRWVDDKAVYSAHDGVGDRAFGGVDSVRVEPAESGSGDQLAVGRYTDDGAACCPAGIERTTLRLSGDELVKVGEPSTWGITRVGLDESGASVAGPTKVEFRSGADRSQLMGDASTPVAATFDARGGQSMQLLFESDDLLERPVVAVITGPNGEIAKAGTGAPVDAAVALPTTGTYRIEFSPVGAVADDVGRAFSALLVIR